MGKTGVAAPLAPALPLMLQNTVPWIRINPKRLPRPPSWASASGAAVIAATKTKTKRKGFKPAIVLFLQNSTNKYVQFLIAEVANLVIDLLK